MIEQLVKRSREKTKQTQTESGDKLRLRRNTRKRGIIKKVFLEFKWFLPRAYICKIKLYLFGMPITVDSHQPIV